MTISKRNALALIEEMNTHVENSVKGFQTEQWNNYWYSKGICSSLTSTVKLINGEGSDLYMYMHGRLCSLLYSTTLKGKASASEEYNGFMVRLDGPNGQVSVAGFLAHGYFPTVNEAKAMIDRIRSLFASKAITV